MLINEVTRLKQFAIESSVYYTEAGGAGEDLRRFYEGQATAYNELLRLIRMLGIDKIDCQVKEMSFENYLCDLTFRRQQLTDEDF